METDCLTILQGDALARLRELPDESIQCCVTSPPYFGLRDYGTAIWTGGMPDCAHVGSDRYYTESTAVISSAGAFTEAGTANAERLKKGRWRESGTCIHCGAAKVDKQIGLEKTPENFVGNLVAIFEETRRVLKSDGTLWLNLGDSYCSTAPGTLGDPLRQSGVLSGVSTSCSDARRKFRPETPAGLKPKDLIGIPWRVAFALQAASWYLRSDIIWSKANCMPESVTDRPTRSHEYIFLFSKSPRYFYDHEAIKEPCIYDVDGTGTQARKARAGEELKSHPNAERAGIRPGGFKDAEKFNGKHDKQRGHPRRHDGFNDRRDKMEKSEQCTGMRNKRDVWTVAPANYPEAHFATFPPALITPCILAGSKPGDTILDPFAGSGTTGQVALELGRKAVLIELNPDYIKLIEQRCSLTPGLAL